MPVTLKPVQGERLDYAPKKQNCVSCQNLQGRLCVAYGAFIQTRGTAPNDCDLYIPRSVNETV